MEVPAGITQTNKLFETLVSEGNLKDLSKVYTAGATILPPGSEMITGLANIEAFWQAAAASMGVTSLKLNTLSMDILGDAAVEIGRADVITDPSKPPASLKYVVKWKHTSSLWLWDVDIWN